MNSTIDSYPHARLKRPGIDHDIVKPWNWATLVGHSKPVEILSFPTPENTIMIRTTVGDPTTLIEVALDQIAAFDPSRHEDFYEGEKS